MSTEAVETDEGRIQGGEGGTVAEPLRVEIIHEIDHGTVLGWYAKGHHDPDAFLDAVEHYEGERRDWPPRPKNYVRHTRWRNVPLMPTHGYCGHRFVEGTGRGAYRVTVFDLDQYGRDCRIGSILKSNENSLSEHRRLHAGCEDDPCTWAVYMETNIARQRRQLEAARDRIGTIAPPPDSAVDHPSTDTTED